MNLPKIWCSQCRKEGTVKNRKWFNGLAYCKNCFGSKMKHERKRKISGAIHVPKTITSVVVINPTAAAM